MRQHFQYPYKTGTVNIPLAGKVHYVDEGKGDQTIVFIHGLANYALGWKRNFEVLRKFYRCIAIDLPGNGLSECGDFPYSLKYYSEVLAAFTEALSLKRVHFAGHSMGGQIALTTLLSYPGIAEKLILCAPAGFEVFTPWEAAVYQTSLTVFDYFSTEKNSLIKSIRSSFYHSTHQADEMIQDLTRLMDLYPISAYRRMVNACIHGMLHEPVFEHLHRITQSTLVIFGERDALIPARALHPVTTRAIAEEGVSRMPDASLYLIPGAGHFVQWEKADSVNELIRNFLS